MINYISMIVNVYNDFMKKVKDFIYLLSKMMKLSSVILLLRRYATTTTLECRRTELRWYSSVVLPSYDDTGSWIMTRIPPHKF